MLTRLGEVLGFAISPTQGVVPSEVGRPQLKQLAILRLRAPIIAGLHLHIAAPGITLSVIRRNRDGPSENRFSGSEPPLLGILSASFLDEGDRIPGLECLNFDHSSRSLPVTVQGIKKVKGRARRYRDDYRHDDLKRNRAPTLRKETLNQTVRRYVMIGILIVHNRPDELLPLV